MTSKYNKYEWMPLTLVADPWHGHVATYHWHVHRPCKASVTMSSHNKQAEKAFQIGRRRSVITPKRWKCSTRPRVYPIPGCSAPYEMITLIGKQNLPPRRASETSARSSHGGTTAPRQRAQTTPTSKPRSLIRMYQRQNCKILWGAWSINKLFVLRVKESVQEIVAQISQTKIKARGRRSLQVHFQSIPDIERPKKREYDLGGEQNKLEQQVGTKWSQECWYAV